MTDQHDAAAKPKGITLARTPAFIADEADAAAARPTSAKVPVSTAAEVTLRRFEGAPVYRLEHRDGAGSLERTAALLQQALAIVAADADVRALVVVLDGFRESRAAEDQKRVVDVARAIAACPVPVVSILKGSVETPGVLLAVSGDVVIVESATELAFDANAVASALGEGECRALLIPWLGAERAGIWATRGVRGTGGDVRIPGVEVLREDAIGAALDAVVGAILEDEVDALRLLRRRLAEDAVAALSGDVRALAVQAQPPTLPASRWAQAPDVVGADDLASFEALPLDSEVVSLRHDGHGTVIVSMHDRENKNAFSSALVRGLFGAFEVIAASDQFKVVVLTGYEQYFASGGTKDVLHKIQQGQASYHDVPVYDVALRCPIPVIAAMQGHAIGVGWTLGLYADLPIFSEESVFSCSMMKYGFTPGAGSTFMFPFRLGAAVGREAQYTAREYRGGELRNRHIDYPVVPRKEVLPLAVGIARRLARQTRAELLASKAHGIRLLRPHLEGVHRVELAMHERTFRGNANVRMRIDASYDRGGPPPASEAQHHTSTGVTAAPVTGEPVAPATVEVDADMVGRLRQMLAEELYMPADEVDDRTGFGELGVDSIIGVTWIRRINKAFGLSIAATKIYNYPTLREFARYVCGELATAGRAPMRDVEAPVEGAAARAPAEIEPARSSPEPVSPAPIDAAPVGEPSPVPSAVRRVADARGDDVIAIIGMSARFPKARDADAFWTLLRDGRDGVDFVPSERWRVDDYFDARPGVPGKTYCKHMGAIDDVDRFDPLFFNLSPSDADHMDPQQRVFLEHAWACFEDAGYGPEALSGARCGVFAGCGAGDYGAGRERGADGFLAMMGGSTSILAARIAYHLNLQGPCLAIDTACSSGLVAIAEACNSLVLGDSDLALAGGVTVLVGPTMHTLTSQAGMLSKDGRCFAFDHRANGFVPSEGVGVVLLKRLGDAVRDGDAIYAVIRGWGVNQDGKTNGITAPNQASQARLERRVYERSGVNPRCIQLVEAHGTGTNLGDPIEVEALIESFRCFTRDEQFCALGSVKSNIGHTLAASGVAGLLKVLLAMKHRTLPPTIHFEAPNPQMRLESSPFYVNTACREWIAEPGKARTAAVSSFGLSGTNAHVVIEEYVPSRTAGPTRQGPALFVLSARTKERLGAYAERLLAFLDAGVQEGLRDADLHALAHTFQVGRAALEARLAVVSDSIDDLRSKLRSFLRGDARVGVLVGHALRRVPSTQHELEALGTRAAQAIEGDRPLEVLEAWVRGAVVDWSRLDRDPSRRPPRMHAPTYPFARERHWLPSVSESDATTGLRAERAPLHPLVHRNVSSSGELRYRSTFTGTEPFLTDHVVGGARLLPGAAFIGMIAAAVAMAKGREPNDVAGLCIDDVVWPRPFVVHGEARDLEVSVRPDATGNAFRVEVSSPGAAGGEPEVHCRASVTSGSFAEDRVDLASLERACDRGRIDGAECYAAFCAAGIEYGASHRVIESLVVGEEQVIARLRERDGEGTGAPYGIHPGVLDGALQATLGLMVDPRALRARDHTGLRPTVPFSIGRVELRGPSSRAMRAWTRFVVDGAGRGVAIDLLDEDGVLCCRMSGLASRPVPASRDASIETVMFTAEWAHEHCENRASNRGEEELRVVVSSEGTWLDAVEGSRRGHDVRRLTTAGDATDRFMGCATQTFAIVKRLLGETRSRPILLQFLCPREDDGPGLAGIVGLFRAAHLEDPAFTGQVILVARGISPAALVPLLEREAAATRRSLIRYVGERREVVTWKEATPRAVGKTPWRARGVYLVTGGLGGIGRAFAAAIASGARDATVVLAGRAKPDESARRWLDELRAKGATVEYAQVDVRDAAAVRGLVDRIVDAHGAIHGVIHAAGIVRDGFIVRKDADEFAEVLGPKVLGTVNLDAATRELPLDFFVLFSSLASVIGNVGQADYAVANAFMDQFAHHRAGLVEVGRRQGQTMTVNWPLWRDGGMGVAAEMAAMMRARMGMVPMSTEAGLSAFAACLAGGQAQALIVEGEAARVRAFLRTELIEDARPAEGRRASLTARDLDAGELVAASGRLKRAIGDVLAMSPDAIDDDAPFEEYGIDSIKVLALTARLERDFGPLAKTLFFEYRTTRELARYLAESRRPEETRLVAAEGSVPSAAPPSRPSRAATDDVCVTPPTRGAASSSRRGEGPSSGGDDGIAIIGMAGRYPGARNVDELWSNLARGANCITEVPAERWNWREHYSEDRSIPGRHYSKWGGFVDDADKFDASFFSISPREAQIMDPQERLFLEEAWGAVEDAGYTRKTLKERHRGEVGVYAAAMYHEYQLFGVERRMGMVGNAATIANRISYVLDLHGPSMTVDTMCSGSLTSVHLACRDLRDGIISLALAGGVNLTVHPNKYLVLSGAQFISSEGRCASFGAGGDGYVPGEGVGVLVLKRLADAERDGDRILGVIRASALNHGGKTSGYTVPNPTAQTSVIVKALARAGVDPRTVTYLEAHGTGTKLGDPIEIASLVAAFGESPGRPECPIGSVKSNLGHCESAAGVAGITKVLLQLQHRKIAPSLHSETLNPFLDFGASSFVVNQRLRDWEALRIDDETIPRRAGISSFGAAGANAHVILEEYRPPRALRAAGDDASPSMIVLSAKTDEQLDAYVARLLDVVRQGEGEPTPTLAEIAYTLQIGREPMASRLGILASSRAELRERLEAVLAGRSDENVQRSQPAPQAHALRKLLSDEDQSTLVANWLARREFAKVLRLWVSGGLVDWALLYADGHPVPAHLPTYPFARERHWVPSPARAPVSESVHPLLDRNASSIRAFRFVKRFERSDFVIAEHRVQGRCILPGVAHLEMAMAAGRAVAERPVAAVRSLTWGTPVVLEGDHVDVQIELAPRGEDALDFVIRAGHDAATVFSRGTLELRRAGEAESLGSLNVTAITARCPQRRSREELDAAFAALGFEYGPSFRTMDSLQIGDGEALGQISLSAERVAEAARYTLHPSLLDAAIRSSLGLVEPGIGDATLRIPYSVDEVRITKPLPARIYVRATPRAGAASGVRRYDFDLADGAGEIVARIRGLHVRALVSRPAGPRPRGPVDAPEVRHYQPVWREERIANAAASRVDGAFLVFDDVDERFEAIQRRLLPGAIQVKRGRGFARTRRDQIIVDLDDAESRGRFFANVGEAMPPLAGSLFLGSIGVAGAPRDELIRLLALVQGLLTTQPGRALRCLYLHGAGAADAPLHEAVAAIAKSFVSVNHRFALTCVRVGEGTDVVSVLAAELGASSTARHAEVRYDGGVRRERAFELCAPVATTGLVNGGVLGTGGAYVITGGAGGLGLIFARHLIGAHGAKVTLLGRSELTAAKAAALDAIRAAGGEVHYDRCDVTERASLGAALARARARFGRIDGVLHCAGVEGRTPLLEASVADLTRVLDPKLEGTRLLDELTREDPLRAFVLFSSLSARLGDFGVGAYAAANRFLDGFAFYREGLRRAGERNGKTVAMDWPLWEDGGFKADEDTVPAEVRELYERTGLASLRTRDGIDAFERALASSTTSWVVISGAPGGIDRLLATPGSAQELSVARAEPVGVTRGRTSGAPPAGGDRHARVVDYLREHVALVTKAPVSAIQAHIELDAYGIDSVMIMELNRLLASDFRDLPGTLLFEYRSIQGLAAYLVENHATEVDVLVERSVNSSADASPPASELAPAAEIAAPPAILVRRSEGDDIAIIGMSGRYPKARNVSELWANLAGKVDAIEEIPIARWDVTACFDPERKPGKTYSKWGGFIDDVDRFDALFFNMAPVQATQADPQLRLLLMTAWEAIEDAGYTRATLCKDAERRTGVFVGSMWSEYALLASGDAPSLANDSSLANHISYFFDFHGPSLVLDTACSSSLYALALACESIRRGDSDTALACGVNLSLHPNKYVGLSQMGFLSSDGRCRSFGAGGNGYVPGEGVGCLVLKGLRQAEADGDPILGVIRASVTNHGGKTNGATVPNPDAQSKLVARALAEAGLSPEEVTYIEAHGTGTELGDPIEVRALTKVFAAGAERRAEKCAIGSIKSNIGHLEGAAGVAAVTKVLLQMKHGQLAPSLHSDNLNPLIDFERSPFALQRELAHWTPPRIWRDGAWVDGPRIAGISSFGAGGANAHVIIAEHRESVRALPSEGTEDVLFVLSARNRDALVAYAQRLLRHIRESDTPLGDVAYTLQVGRETMGERLAILSASRTELDAQLARFVADSGACADERRVFVGHLPIEHGRVRTPDPSSEIDREIDAHVAGGRLEQLAGLWVKGHTIDWPRLHAGRDRRRVSLPTYPFATTRHWHGGSPGGERTARAPLHDVRTAPVETGARAEWLYLSEEWVDAEVPMVSDWNARLELYAGATIAVVGATRTETEIMAALLRKVEAAARPTKPLRVVQYTLDSLQASALRDDPPAVVLACGPTRAEALDSAWDAQAIVAVFRLSQSLMQAAWGTDIEIFYVFEGGPDQRRIDCEALSGFLGSAVKENENHRWRMIAHYDPTLVADRYQVVLREWLGAGARSSNGSVPLLREVRYEARRWEKTVIETTLAPAPADPFRPGGTYVIAGGMGYVGEGLCRRLAERYRANLYILSRGPLTQERRRLCDELRQLGGGVRYLSVDMTDSEATREAFRTIRSEASRIDGVINLVRAHESRGIVAKSEESFECTSRVKVLTTYNLDQATKDEPLDFFMTFSSLGAHGARGDCDYAYSAAYQSVFASHRNRLRAAGKRSGRAITQCWGPWGGDRLFPESRERMRAFGFGLIETEAAWEVIAASVYAPEDALSLMLVTDREKVGRAFLREVPMERESVGGSVVRPSPAKGAERALTGAARVSERLRTWEDQWRRGRSVTAIGDEVRDWLGADGVAGLDESTLDRLSALLDGERAASTTGQEAAGPDPVAAIRAVVAEVLGLGDVDDEQSFQNYGVDSILAMKITTRIEKALGKEVKPQWLIEYPTVRVLARHLANGVSVQS